MSKQVSAAEAKARFAECLRSAEDGEPVVITRYGKPVAAIVSAEELERLRRLRAAGPRAGLYGLVGRFDDMDDFVDDVQKAAAQRGPPRPTPSLE